MLISGAIKWQLHHFGVFKCDLGLPQKHKLLFLKEIS